MRSRAVTAIAWGWLAMGVLLAVGGASGALDRPIRTREADPFDFPFTHPLVFAAVVETLAMTLILASLGLLRLRRWGARVIEVAAWLGLLVVAGFAAWAAGLAIILGVATDITHHQPWFLPGFGAMLLLNLGVLGTPLVLTVRYLRRHETKAVLS